MDSGSVEARAGRRRFIAGTTALTLTAPYVLGADRAKPGLRAGAAETVVTPDKGTPLAGPEKPSEGTHDDLFARVLVLDDGAKRLIIATLDYLGFDFAYTNLLIAAIAESADVPPSNVMLNSSHTHSAPLTAPWGPWLKEKNLSFHRFLPERLAAITREAAKNLRLARLRHHREPVQIGFNRRLLNAGKIVMAPNPNGAVLPWVDVLCVDQPDGKHIAVLFSYAAHPVIVHNTSSFCSADYPGFAVQTIRRKLKGKVICLFAQGCSGNINAFPLQGGLEAAKAAGRDLGQAVLRAVANSDARPADGGLQAVSTPLNLPHQEPPSAASLRTIIAKEKNAGKRARREALLAVAESDKKPTMPYPIRAFSVGSDFCLMGMPHEPFAEYHLFADKATPFKRNFVLGYTNGLECYVGTKSAYELGRDGGYETSPFGAALMFENRLPLALRAEKMIHKGMSDTYAQLRKLV